MKRQSSRFTVPDWAKWTLLSGLILFLICAALSIWMYIDVRNDVTSEHDEAKAIALKETELSSVEDVTVYHGDRAVHILQGLFEDGEKGLVFVQVEDEEVLDVSLQTETEFLSLDEMKDQWRSSCGGCSFKKISYAYEEGQPVFELIYIDRESRYVFDYYTLSGESFDQRFAFKQNL
ncbi:DUF5590 domain-containing protein [Halobacillus litoralis]|uniref:cell wall elongation regulator TseB-like domain-containing protein n=1 Tax=Halobacillus litoralis TaxID=45668 RepID=UPI001CD7CE00|nr:DUF5590 domain-containing protein [Halobacillus litoralis]MCA0970377.1 DUF5590 domain-containing protein [Halobacillus litoralis]